MTTEQKIQMTTGGYAMVQRVPEEKLAVIREGDKDDCCYVKLPPGWINKNIVCILTEE
jgi:hypothetical protein